MHFEVHLINIIFQNLNLSFIHTIQIHYFIYSNGEIFLKLLLLYLKNDKMLILKLKFLYFDFRIYLQIYK